MSAAHGTLVVSQQLLADHLRALYEEGDVDPLAIVLGSESLDDAMTRLDDLSHVADQNRQVVAATRAAQTRLVRLRTTLAAHRARVDATLGRARRAAEALAAARAERLLVHRQPAPAAAPRSRRDRRTRGDRAASRDEVADDPAGSRSAAGQLHDDTGARADPGPHTLTVSSTGYSLPGHTASGLPVGWGIVAVDPSVIPLGTKLTIPGYGEAVAADVGSGVHGAMIDLWFPTLALARAWGRRTVTITLH